MNKCPACLSTENFTLIKRPNDFEYSVVRKINCHIQICSECQTIFQNPLPPTSEASTFYNADYQNYFKNNGSILKFLMTNLTLTFAKKYTMPFTSVIFPGVELLLPE